MKIYSPSQTKLFMECPQKWWLQRKQGWNRKWMRKNDVAALVGGCIGAVLQKYISVDVPIETYLADLDSMFNERMDVKQQDGYIIEEDVWARYDSYKNTFPKVIKAYRQSSARIPDTWTNIQTEFNVGNGEDHNAFIDVCGVEPDGSHFIWDFKCKMYLKTCDQASELLGYRHDWQMMHYGWFYWVKTGIWPARYYIGMPVLGPTPAFVGGNDTQGLGVFSYNPSDLIAWHESASTWWSMMEQCEQQGWAPMSAQHTGRYGNCEMYDACFTYKQNPDMLQSAYIQITR